MGQTCEQRSEYLHLYTHAVLVSPAVGQAGEEGQASYDLKMDAWSFATFLRIVQ